MTSPSLVAIHFPASDITNAVIILVKFIEKYMYTKFCLEWLLTLGAHAQRGLR